MYRSSFVVCVVLVVTCISALQALASRVPSSVISEGLTDILRTSHSSGRSLLNKPHEPNNPSWFRDSITDKNPYRHIVLKNHLDITNLPLIKEMLLGTISGTTVSIQGDCSGAPTYSPPGGHAPMLPLKPGQCVILVDTDVMEIVGTKLWINNIYFRFTKPRPGSTSGGRSPYKQMIKVSGEGAALYMTNVTLQGNGDKVRDCNNCAFQASKKGRVFGQDIIVSDMDGERGAQITSGSSASIIESEFKSLNIFPPSGWTSLKKDDGWSREYGSAAIEVDAEGTTYGNSLFRYEKSNIAQVTPTGWNTGGYVFVFPVMRDERGTDAQALVYGDDWVTNICWLEGDRETLAYNPVCSQRNRLELSTANPADFLSMSDEFPTTVQQELENNSS